MKHYILLLSAVFYSTTPLLFAINIEKAIAQKLIQISDNQSNVSIDNDFSLTVKNISGKPQKIVIPIGTFFMPEDSSYQPRYTISPSEGLLSIGEVRTFNLSTVCANAPKYAPTNNTKYALVRPTNQKIEALSQFLNTQTSPFEKYDIQNAVWSITNNHRIEGIQNEALKTTLSKITGQQIQPYKFTYQHENIPGQVAYSNKALKVEGLFRYGTDKDIAANFGLYDQDGKLVKMLSSNMIHKRGQHSFRFNFTFTNVKSGTYYIRLSSGNVLLNEMQVIV